MKKQNKYAEIGLKALKRAAKKVAEDARKNEYKIPVWRDGRIQFEIPGITTEQLGQPDGWEQRCANRAKFSGRRWLPLAFAARLRRAANGRAELRSSACHTGRRRRPFEQSLEPRRSNAVGDRTSPPAARPTRLSSPIGRCRTPRR